MLPPTFLWLLRLVRLRDMFMFVSYSPHYSHSLFVATDNERKKIPILHVSLAQLPSMYNLLQGALRSHHYHIHSNHHSIRTYDRCMSYTTATCNV